MEPKLIIDDSRLSSLNAELCQVQSTREETILLFGTRRPAGEAQDARLERRIILSPGAAKRLLLSLQRALSEHAQMSIPAGARPLLQAMLGLGPRFGIEKSIKLSPGEFNAQRVIFAAKTARHEPRAILDACRRVAMPQALFEQFSEHLRDANTFGLGYEADARGGAFKVYLEFWDRLKTRLQREPAERAPALLFLGFKWAAADPAKAGVARYVCHPLLSVEGIRRRLDALFEGCHGAASHALARALLRLAAPRIGNDAPVYVEVEEDSPRKSFDLNFYKAGLTLGELAPLLAPLCKRFAISRARLEPLLADARTRPVGHLSGGIGRDGKDFITVYYEIEGL